MVKCCSKDALCTILNISKYLSFRWQWWPIFWCNLCVQFVWKNKFGSKWAEFWSFWLI